MCMTNAYIETGGERELLLEDVSRVEVKGTRVRVETLFGESREIDAVITEIDFQNASIVLESLG